MRVLVLGGYGFIGLAIMKALAAAGHEAAGLGRSAGRGRAALPDAEWIAADIAALKTAEAWRPHLAGVDAVVNAAGVLQTGGGDDLAGVRDGTLALIAACAAGGLRRFVQISATGASADSPLAFMRAKGEVDAALAASGLEWTVLRPGLVIGPSAYGGTSLVRMLAAFPLVLPVAAPEAPVQTVALDDVAAAAVRAVDGGLVGASVDLVEDEAHALKDLILAVRAWLGYPPPRAVIAPPRFMAGAFALGADAAGALGWRPALRSTSFKVLADGVRGDPAAWRATGGPPLKSLAETLAALPATAQERLYARVQLVFPPMLLTLAAFWIASGGIGLARLDAAAALFGPALDEGAARAAVVVGGLADLAVGAGLLVRRAMRTACLASIAVSAIYLAGGSMLTPDLWADPLGPLVKVFPAMALALGVLAAAPQR